MALGVLALNYGLMTFLIKHFEWYPTIARAVSAVSIGALSFVVHKTFSFKVSNTDEVSEEDDVLKSF